MYKQTKIEDVNWEICNVLLLKIRYKRSVSDFPKINIGYKCKIHSQLAGVFSYRMIKNCNAQILSCWTEILINLKKTILTTTDVFKLQFNSLPPCTI